MELAIMDSLRPGEQHELDAGSATRRSVEQSCGPLAVRVGGGLALSANM